MVYSYNGILLGHKKELNGDSSYNAGLPWKHYAKWKKPVTKSHMFYDSIYMKCLKQTDP